MVNSKWIGKVNFPLGALASRPQMSAKREKVGGGFWERKRRTTLARLKLPAGFS